MIEVRDFNSLGGANHGWLDARHHFSLARYRDPDAEIVLADLPPEE